MNIHRLLALGAAVVAMTAFGNRTAHAAEGYFDSDGVKIHYVVEGEGEPVLLIHGFSANAALNWSLPGVFQLLAEDYRVIALDNRGHGRSDKPETPEEYGVNMVTDAVGLLDHLGIEKAHVVGYSMGGMITMKMMVDHPDRMISAVVGGMGWMEDKPEEAGRYRNPQREIANKAHAACFRSFFDLSLSRAEVEGIKTPTLIVVGSEDPLLQSRVKPLQAVRPDFPVTLIEGGNHATCLFKPEFKTIIKDFIDKNRGTAGAIGANETVK